jgi:hypothetical protein
MSRAARCGSLTEPLETHGRDVGYEIGAWIDDALLTAAVELAREHDEVPVLIEQVRLATLALTQAAAATAEDRMLVPDRLAKGLTHLLAVYAIAERLNGATAPRPRQGHQP